MRVLILGASGMLGHKLAQILSRRYEVCASLRNARSYLREHPALAACRAVGGVSARSLDDLIGLMGEVRPDAVVNCIGIVKQVAAAEDPLVAVPVNALFPHRLSRLCQAVGCRLIHLSTDCVFSGRRGNYTEDDVPDPLDLYGRSKLLGEVSGPGSVTLRTSIIGPELRNYTGLLEWFISQRGGTVNGYSKAIYSGFPTGVLAELIGDILESHADLSGVWHVSSEPISKYELLRLIDRTFDLGITIRRDTSFTCDRSLDSSRFKAATGFTPPTWADMIDQMASDQTPYER